MADLEKATRKAQEFRQREQQILDAALALFLEFGEDRVTVEMIADRVGIGKGTIYKHFETKNEIYLLLMLRYEEDLAELFNDISETDDKETLAREYFRFRISDPQRYQLFDRLENKVIKDHAVPDLVEKLHRIRESNFERLTHIVKARVQEGSLEDVPAIYHICSAWALAHGAVALMQSPFYQRLIEDKDDFLDFLVEIGIRMGNRGQRGK
ncbi:TetR/AcrR family transcriptional regulator [Alloalcanivorax mobilis]|uniref:TetR/AcrR family transcriptional regulator n=1 Tax=Alloalcanivorax mobilis TaxID=2019569 RepID=UPI000B5B27F2|nr:TetR/AcrR family transcriptional regulator [Alloalcanivorax mobilis]ASK34332.1 TetR family transcriptional regulator [Alcanivorax sp. N3-2A]|tara:strand:+ start:105529 stop:106161 length:633 start_codon:yes stop_codon:yes gene_type:complete